MKYALFNGSTYYPSGGWGDFIGMFSSIEEALKKADKSAFMWWHIVDLERKVIVLEGDSDL